MQRLIHSCDYHALSGRYLYVWSRKENFNIFHDQVWFWNSFRTILDVVTPVILDKWKQLRSAHSLLIHCIIIPLPVLRVIKFATHWKEVKIFSLIYIQFKISDLDWIELVFTVFSKNQDLKKTETFVVSLQGKFVKTEVLIPAVLTCYM